MQAAPSLHRDRALLSCLPAWLARDVQTRVAMSHPGHRRKYISFLFLFPKAFGLSLCGLELFQPLEFNCLFQNEKARAVVMHVLAMGNPTNDKQGVKFSS